MSSTLEQRPIRGKRSTDIDASHAAGFSKDGYTWGRFGLPEAGWFPGVAPSHYPPAWREGWARGHAEWLLSRECHLCGAIIETHKEAVRHQREIHPWTKSGEEVIHMTTTPDEHEHEPEKAPGPGQPDPDPTVDPTVPNPVTPAQANPPQSDEDKGEEEDDQEEDKDKSG
jgi:hypothetical protein